MRLQVLGHGLLLFLIVGYVGGAIATAQILEVPERITLSTLTLTHPMVVIVAVLALLLWLLNRRHARPAPVAVTPDNGRGWRRALPSPQNLMVAIPTFLGMILLIQTFSSIKTMIPLLQPYSHWDVDFAEWDRLLHGNIDPWRILQPVVGYPVVTWTLNAIYYFLWFPILLAMLFWQCFDLRRPSQRLQFLLTFALAWILLGSIAATAFSSAGPCYFGRVTGLDDPFVPLIDYLKRVNESHPLLALTVQEKLWQFYSSRTFVQGAAISAMPSLHVAMAFLFALSGWRVNRYLGILLSLFTVVIFIGSVHLGWHYAIDGYVSIIAIWAIWKGVGSFLDRNSTRPGRVARPMSSS